MNPAIPRRMIAYPRVSRVGARDVESDGYQTESIQIEACQGWGKARSIEIVTGPEYLDRDESGAKDERPGLERAIQAVCDGRADGIVVATLDRLSRQSTIDALKRVAEIQDAGGVIASVGGEVPVDPTSDTGEFILTLFVAIARMEWRRYASRWEVAKTRAVSRGVKIGPTPYGYQREKSKPLTPHPVQAPIVREAFARAAAAAPEDKAHEALAYLAANASETDDAPEGELTPTGLLRLQDRTARAWTLHRVRRLLRNRTYLGESRYGDDLHRADAHEPLVTRATWEAAQPEDRQGRRPSSNYPLSGIATCEGCKGPMTGGMGGSKVTTRVYRCADSASKKGTCDAPAMMTAERLEGYVFSIVEAALEGAHGFEASAPEAEELASAEAAMLEDERDLVAFASDTTARGLLGDRYHPIMEAKVQKAEVSSAAYRALAARGHQRAIPAKDAAQEDWPTTLRAVLASVVVKRGRGGSVADRVAVGFYGSDELAGVPAA